MYMPFNLQAMVEFWGKLDRDIFEDVEEVGSWRKYENFPPMYTYVVLYSKFKIGIDLEGKITCVGCSNQF
jgi:hypothetical protein